MPHAARCWRRSGAPSSPEEFGQGDRLLTLEAIKVLMYVNSPLDATVEEVLVAPLDHVESGDLLVVFE
jgi:biotin carboxyl carrier protein